MKPLIQARLLSILSFGSNPSDNDGMPDEWELSKGLDPNDSIDFRLITESGYTNLEIYLSELLGDEITTAVNEIERRGSEVLIFPNPFTNQLNIKSKDLICTVELYDFVGRKVMNVSNQSGINSISLNGLKPGYYILKTRSSVGKIVYEKVIKK